MFLFLISQIYLQTETIADMKTYSATMHQYLICKD